MDLNTEYLTILICDTALFGKYCSPSNTVSHSRRRIFSNTTVRAYSLDLNSVIKKYTVRFYIIISRGFQMYLMIEWANSILPFHNLFLCDPFY
jgi:hypothetical protein